MDADKLSNLRRSDAAHHLHPFTDHAEMHRSGTHIVSSASGCHVVDETGRRLLDGLAGLWCVNVGYGRQEIADAVHRQMMACSFYPSFLNSTNEPAIALAERLAGLAPKGMNKVFFASSGSEANETALKLIRAYQKLRGKPNKRTVLARTFAYHGVGLATASLTGLPTCQTPFDLPLPGFLHVPGPHPYGVNSALSPAEYAAWCLKETEQTIEREGAETIAAFFAEPIQGAGGVIVPPPGHLAALRELCRANDILFVADEVITGFGRIGGWFASSLWDLQPDMLVTAKGITSGYVPLGATLIADPVAEVLSRGYLAHGFTYSGHPVAAAAALANLDILQRERLIERVHDDIGPYFQKQLHALAGHPAVGEVRGTGLIGAIDVVPRGGLASRPFGPDLASRPFGPDKAALQTPPVLGARMTALCREQGVIVRGIRDLIAMSPPLIVTHAEVDQLFAAVGSALDRLWD